MKIKNNIVPLFLLIVCVWTKNMELSVIQNTRFELGNSCLTQARNCATILRYTKCKHLILKEIKCNIRERCLEDEFTYLHSLACRGEQLLRSLSLTLDSVCARRLDTPNCNIGLEPLNIFDYGNISQQKVICNNAIISFTDQCISGAQSPVKVYDCSPDEYGRFLNVVCAVNVATELSFIFIPTLTVIIAMLCSRCLVWTSSHGHSHVQIKPINSKTNAKTSVNHQNILAACKNTSN